MLLSICTISSSTTILLNYSYSSSSSSSSLLVRTICRASGLDYILLLSVLSVWVRAASTHSLLMEPRPSISHFTMSP